MENPQLRDLVAFQLKPVIVKDEEGRLYEISSPDWSGYLAVCLDTGQRVTLGYYSRNYTLVKQEDYLSKMDELKKENTELRKVYNSSCPECGYQGCVRGRKACDSQIDTLERENEQLRDGLMKIITVYCSNLSERTYNELLERAFDEVKPILENKR